MAELFANFASTTLNGTILSGATSLVVTSAAAFPATGNFRILVENEIMLVTAVSTNTFTITRAQEGTTAANHNSGVLVTHILTAGAIKQAKFDAVTPLFASLATDTTLSTTVGSPTTLASIVTTTTSVMFWAYFSGVQFTAPGTIHITFSVDGVTQNGAGGFLESVNNGAGFGTSVNGFITGLTNASHTFALLAAFSTTGGSATIHASSNPTLEGARLMLLPLS